MKRNIFDHYSQLENHVTNSLLSVLNENPRLTHGILQELGVKVKPQRLRVLSQRLPIQVKGKDSVIDGSIFGEDYKFCIGIENKIVPGAVNPVQIKAHLSQLEHYSNGILWIISPDKSIDLHNYKLPQHLTLHHSSWAALTSALRRFETLTTKEHGLFLYKEFIAFLERMPQMTGFHGFRFDYGYDDDLAKSYVKRITPELTPCIRRVYKECKNTRNAISGFAWDSWYPTKQSQISVHPGYSIHADYLRCTIVLANGCSREWRRFYEKLESNPNSFLRLLSAVEMEKPKHSEAVVSFRQRHYPSQKAPPVNDAETYIQCHTLLGKRGAKKNLLWLSLIKQVASTKRQYNYQLEVGYNISFLGNNEMKSAKALEIMKQCFISLKPIYDYFKN